MARLREVLSGGRTGDSDNVSVARLREREAGASNLGRNIPDNEQRTAARLSYEWPATRKRDSWLGESEVRASIPGRNILWIEQHTVVQRGPAGLRTSDSEEVSKSKGE